MINKTNVRFNFDCSFFIRNLVEFNLHNNFIRMSLFVSDNLFLCAIYKFVMFVFPIIEFFYWFYFLNLLDVLMYVI